MARLARQPLVTLPSFDPHQEIVFRNVNVVPTPIAPLATLTPSILKYRAAQRGSLPPEPC